MLVDRGPVEPGQVPCKFAEKVWNAQAAGARGVIVASYDDTLTTMEAPDDDDELNYKYLANITIPASFVTKSSGSAIKSLLKGGQPVYVSLDWTDVLPKKQLVSWEFWTNSNDLCGPVCDIQRDFIKDFVPVAKEFDSNGWTSFTPHYIIWTCPSAYRDSNECQSQCVRRGRYCAPDPDGSLQEGYSGAEVVQENLRQLCVFKLASEQGKPYIWWDYTTKFSQKCTMSKQDYGQRCAEEVFKEIIDGDGSWSSVEALRQCIGTESEDQPHPVLEEQLKAQHGEGGEGEVFILPTIRINGAQYRGKMAVTDVLRAICAGYVQGNQPNACSRVIDDLCMQGAEGFNDCSARKDGKTMCINTFSGYKCSCGHGFISHLETDGSETCLDINECLSISHLDPNCTCPRCGCKNTFGGYECVPDITDECADNWGGCWHGEDTVKGTKMEFSGCKDNLVAYKDALAHGQPTDDIPLHTCGCPPCFNAIQKNEGTSGGGKTIVCEKKCNLDRCELELGVCHGSASGSDIEGSGGNGVGVGAVVAIIIACTAVVAAVGFAAHKWHMKTAMQAEVRAIMAQYMPLAEEGGAAESPKNIAGLRLTHLGNNNNNNNVSSPTLPPPPFSASTAPPS